MEIGTDKGENGTTPLGRVVKKGNGSFAKPAILPSATGNFMTLLGFTMKAKSQSTEAELLARGNSTTHMLKIMIGTV